MPRQLEGDSFLTAYVTAGYTGINGGEQEPVHTDGLAKAQG